MGDPTREAQREIVRDWLDTGFETGRMEYDELLDRLAALSATPAPDDPSDAPLNDAMYECCIEPPDTEHAEHVLTALNRNGWTLTRLAPHE